MATTLTWRWLRTPTGSPHVQIADHPGRGEPGTGTLDLGRYLSTIEAGGYSGYVGLEYIPTTTTIDSLRWLRQEKVIRS